jgi:hypothetical protein
MQFGWWETSVLALALNVLAVSIPGRFDADRDVLTKSPWPTLFNPAGFAFAIWGVIYIGEVAGLIHLKFAEPSQASSRVADSNDFWILANVAQSLWCVTFRPYFLNRLWLSAMMLSATAGCLFLAVCRANGMGGASTPQGWLTGLLSAGSDPLPPGSGWFHLLVCVPRELHLGWITAATLVNLNAWVGLSQPGAATVLAAVILSIAAAALCSALYLHVQAPAASLAVAWALFSLSRGKPVGVDAVSLGGATLAGIAKAEAAAAATILGSVALALFMRF